MKKLLLLAAGLAAATVLRAFAPHPSDVSAASTGMSSCPQSRR